MNTIVMKCPNCGANVDFDEGQEVGFCKYCGTKVMQENPSVQKIKIDNPIKIDGKVKLVNNEFESKLAQVETSIDLYFKKENPNEDDYNIIASMLSELERIGADDSRYYLTFCRFYINANIEGFEKNTRHLINKKQFLDVYDTAMENAIKYAESSTKKEEIRSQYTEERPKIEEALNKAEKKSGENYKKQMIIVSIIALALVIVPIIIVALTVPTF